MIFCSSRIVFGSISRGIRSSNNLTTLERNSTFRSNVLGIRRSAASILKEFGMDRVNDFDNDCCLSTQCFTKMNHFITLICATLVFTVSYAFFVKLNS